MGGIMHNGAYNVREFKRLLLDNGFEYVRQTGSHIIYKRDNETLSMPSHKPSQTCLYDLIKQYNLKRGD